MTREYDAVHVLVVELWEKGKGFSLHLGFEPHFELDEHNRDALCRPFTVRERRISGRVLRFARSPAALREEGDRRLHQDYATRLRRGAPAIPCAT